MDHADARYLESKRTVDARARNRRVRDRLLADLPSRPDVAEVGAGTGSFVPTLLEWGVDAGTYRGVDRDEGVLRYALATLPDELDGSYSVGSDNPTGHDDALGGFRVGDLDVSFAVGDLLDEDLPVEAGTADLLVAQAVFDLVPLGPAMDAVERALRPSGLAYLPITFDGVSLFAPEHPADDAVLDAYHAHIDDVPGRDSRAGRHLLDRLRERDADLLAVGASDWVVRPVDGAYPADERHFLGRILDFVADAVGGGDADVLAPADDGDGADDGGDDADDWLATRRRQLADAELTYVAHQYDLLYRAPD
ncbi:class I SAM-dependent methyltransferase [Halobium salinum]|uniref:Class I SAM-dependent methyltransferase n=1 Tax=Halobium salinum TaxID=1364940 RepID=A0ABD5PCM5_9EURY|nr:class I SAM-dependent methyltransferase [Halobium salinum]